MMSAPSPRTPAPPSSTRSTTTTTAATAAPSQIASASDPAHGTVALTGGAPGAHTGLTYEPDPDYCNDAPANPTDDFNYTLNGGSTATVAVTVTCVVDDSLYWTNKGGGGAVRYMGLNPATGGG